MNKLDRSSSIEIANCRFANSTHFDNREWCRSEDVERLESDYAQLEASHAELLKALQTVIDAIDANYAGENPILDVKLGGSSLVALRSKQKLQIGYFVNFFTLQKAFDIARAAIAKAEGEVMP